MVGVGDVAMHCGFSNQSCFCRKDTNLVSVMIANGLMHKENMRM